MEFGKVPAKYLGSIDFSLPPEPAENAAVIKANASKEQNIYVGCVSWGQPGWPGDIYPKGTKATEFVDHYTKSFNSIELNASYYQVPSQKQVDHWNQCMGTDFRVCPKFTKTITHDKELKNTEEDTAYFLKMIGQLKANLGPAFMLLPPHFSFNEINILEAYLQTLPKELALCVEFRHPSWYTPAALNQTFELFERYGIGSIITDTAGKREVIHMRLTNDTAFIRFVGNALHPTDYTRVDEWVQRLKTWYEQGLKNMYFFVHEPDEVLAPRLCVYVIEQLNKHLGLSLKQPIFTQQQTLF